MKRVNQIIQDLEFIEHVKWNEKCEKERIFCKHDMEHFLAVARISMILNLKEELKIEESYVYGAALLHDIGRHEQYEFKIPHEKASVPIAQGILARCGYVESEQALILDAIVNHRNKEVKDQKNLKGILYRGDKLSRACFQCPSNSLCDWKGDKKNINLII